MGPASIRAPRVRGRADVPGRAEASPLTWTAAPAGVARGPPPSPRRGPRRAAHRTPSRSRGGLGPPASRPTAGWSAAPGPGGGAGVGPGYGLPPRQPPGTRQSRHGPVRSPAPRRSAPAWPVRLWLQKPVWLKCRLSRSRSPRSSGEGGPRRSRVWRDDHLGPLRRTRSRAGVAPRPPARLPTSRPAGSGRQAGAALGAAGREDRTAGPGAHAQPEAVGLRAPTVVRLVGALAHVRLSVFVRPVVQRRGRVVVWLPSGRDRTCGQQAPTTLSEEARHLAAGREEAPADANHTTTDPTHPEERARGPPRRPRRRPGSTDRRVVFTYADKGATSRMVDGVWTTLLACAIAGECQGSLSLSAGTRHARQPFDQVDPPPAPNRAEAGAPRIRRGATISRYTGCG